jgi:hypothetical protein
VLLHARSIDFEVIMSFSIRSGVAALAWLPAAAFAWQDGQAGPADAGAPVPAPVYVSAFAGYRPATDEQVAPDQVWRRANEEVGKADADAMPAHAMPAAPAETRQPDPHAGHGSHHNMQGK